MGRRVLGVRFAIADLGHFVASPVPTHWWLWSADTLQMLGGIAGGLLLYDAMFFCGHFLMHEVPLFHKVHAKHHKTQEVRAAEIVRLSIPEEVLEVGFSTVALNLLSVHPMARFITTASESTTTKSSFSRWIESLGSFKRTTGA